MGKVLRFDGIREPTQRLGFLLGKLGRGGRDKLPKGYRSATVGVDEHDKPVLLFLRYFRQEGEQVRKVYVRGDSHLFGGVSNDSHLARGGVGDAWVVELGDVIAATAPIGVDVGATLRGR
jgi:hypothetical protein